MVGKKKACSKQKSSSSLFSSSSRKFVCESCGYATVLKARFTKHVKYHSMPYIKCEFCDFRTQYTWNLDRHMKNHNSLGKMECPLCNFTCDMKQSLTSHVQNHHNNVPEEVLAQFRTNGASSPRKSPESSELDGYQDQQNKDHGSCPPDLKRLKKSNEQEDRSLFMKKFYKCKLCNFNALSEMSLNRHVIQSHPSSAVASSALTKIPNLLQKIKIRSPMPVLLKNSSEISGCSPTVVKTKPMPSLIPIPKGVSSYQTKSSPSNAEKSDCDSAHDDKNQVYEDISKVQFLLQLGLNPKPRPEVHESLGSLYNDIKPYYSSKRIQPQRRTSFFEKLSKKLTSNNNSQISNDLSQTSSVIAPPSSPHPSTASSSIMNSRNGNTINSISITSNSTRCQYCRHRCKTSADLINHLESCREAKRFLVEEEQNEQLEKIEENQIFVWTDENGGNVGDYANVDEENADEQDTQDNMEGQEFFHNFESFSGLTVDLENDGDYEEQMSSPASINSPRGAVTKSRKVYQCPQKDCKFWSITASRFHVHVVGHYNTKPFECSQCSYRSNWRWDITKHIKLKTMRDPGHIKAKVLLTHESGERNYRKYDRYLVPMAVTYNADSKLPDCSTVASKRSDVEVAHSPSPPKSSPSAKSNSNSLTRSSQNLLGGLISMPKLIKAPTLSSLEGTYTSLRQALNSDSLKAITPSLPILKPIITISPMLPSKSSAGRTFVEKRMLAGGEILQNMESLGRDITVTPIISGNSHQLPGDNKPTVTWKCKKCQFKHSSKEQVIFHINDTHKPKSGESMSILSQNNLVQVGRLGTGMLNRQTTTNADYWDCQDISISPAKINSRNSESCDNQEKFGQVYTCAYCQDEFSSRKEIQQHIQCHGVNVNAAVQPVGDDEDDDMENASDLILPEEICAKPRGLAQQDGLVYKKYHCQECPYVTDSKGQFIYHKKFHIPSPNAPYKCNNCSYRVSHKHLLQQHVRVHLLQDHQNAENLFGSEKYFNGAAEEETLLKRPRVLLWKDGKPLSVVRCRFCPQVFVSGDDLMEHEQQHDEGHGSDEGDDNDNNDQVLNLSMKLDPKNLLVGSEKDVTERLSRSPTPSCQSQTPFLYLCSQCPARFLYEKELRIHHTFHERKYEFTCSLCSYTARQEVPHLKSHMNVHSAEYQERTLSLLKGKYRAAPKLTFECCKDNNKSTSSIPPPLRKMKPVTISPSTNSSISEKGDGGQEDTTMSFICDASLPCRSCPARFNTFASFLHHSQQHGKTTQFNCKHCDFGAESRNNLTLHSILHAGSEVTIEPEIADVDNFDKSVSNLIPQQIPTVVPGADANDHGGDHDDGTTDFSVVRAYQGNPNFQYPTFVKNGRVKSKRYKCFKCPSAFEKRDQYKVHMGLHGSMQRYKCTVCDYSVTYYANFIQHLKKHLNQENVSKEQLVATPLSKMGKNIPASSLPVGAPFDCEDAVKIKKVVPPLVLKVPKTIISQKLLLCPHCPFKTENEKTFTDHASFHGRSLKETCPFCDFSSNEKESLKEHLRVHFDTDFQPSELAKDAKLQKNKSDEGTSSDSEDSEVDDYEVAVKKVNKKKVLVNSNPEISVD